MAEGKKSFTAYCDWKGTFDALPDEKAGQLIKHLFAYVNDENPISNDLLINAVFANIKATLKRDLKKWESERELNSRSGRIGNLKRWHPDLYKLFKSGEKSLESLEIIAISRKTSPPDEIVSPPIAIIADSVKDSVSVSVKDNVIKDDDEKNKKTSSPNNSIFTIQECKTKYLSNQRVLNAVSENKKNKIDIKDFDDRLTKFNQHLLENSVELKEYSDYCTHFLRWHKKTKVIQSNKEKITL